jgi:uncharacterized membrane protein
VLSNQDSTGIGSASGQQLLDSRLADAIGYLPGLFFVPLLATRAHPASRHHSAQSLVLFTALCAVGVATWLVDVIFGQVLANMVIAGYFFRALAWVVHYPVGIAVAVGYVAAVVVGMTYASAGASKALPGLQRYVQTAGRWLDMLAPKQGN